MKPRLRWAESSLAMLEQKCGCFTRRQIIELCRDIVGWKAAPEWDCPYCSNSEKFKEDFSQTPELVQMSSKKRQDFYVIRPWACTTCHALNALNLYGNRFVITWPRRAEDDPLNLKNTSSHRGLASYWTAERVLYALERFLYIWQGTKSARWDDITNWLEKSLSELVALLENGFEYLHEGIDEQEILHLALLVSVAEMKLPFPPDTTVEEENKRWKDYWSLMKSGIAKSKWDGALGDDASSLPPIVGYRVLLSYLTDEWKQFKAMVTSDSKTHCNELQHLLDEIFVNLGVLWAMKCFVDFIPRLERAA